MGIIIIKKKSFFPSTKRCSIEEFDLFASSAHTQKNDFHQMANNNIPPSYNNNQKKNPNKRIFFFSSKEKTKNGNVIIVNHHHTCYNSYKSFTITFQFSEPLLSLRTTKTLPGSSTTHGHGDGAWWFVATWCGWKKNEN